MAVLFGNSWGLDKGSIDLLDLASTTEKSALFGLKKT